MGGITGFYHFIINYYRSWQSFYARTYMSYVEPVMLGMAYAETVSLD